MHSNLCHLQLGPIGSGSRPSVMFAIGHVCDGNGLPRKDAWCRIISMQRPRTIAVLQVKGPQKPIVLNCSDADNITASQICRCQHIKWWFLALVLSKCSCRLRLEMSKRELRSVRTDVASSLSQFQAGNCAVGVISLMLDLTNTFFSITCSS